MTSPSIFVNIQAPSSTQLPLQDSPLPNYGGKKVPPRFWIVLFRKPFSFNNKGMLWNFFRKNLCSLREAFLREALLKKETCFCFINFINSHWPIPPFPLPHFIKLCCRFFWSFVKKFKNVKFDKKSTGKMSIFGIKCWKLSSINYHLKRSFMYICVEKRSPEL